MVAQGGEVGGEGEGGAHSEELGSGKASQSQERPEARAGQVGLEKAGEGIRGRQNSLCKCLGAGACGTLGTGRYFEQLGHRRWVVVSNAAQEVSPQSMACEGLERVLRDHWWV